MERGIRHDPDNFGLASMSGSAQLAGHAVDRANGNAMQTPHQPLTLTPAPTHVSPLYGTREQQQYLSSWSLGSERDATSGSSGIDFDIDHDVWALAHQFLDLDQHCALPATRAPPPPLPVAWPAPHSTAPSLPTIGMPIKPPPPINALLGGVPYVPATHGIIPPTCPQVPMLDSGPDPAAAAHPRAHASYVAQAPIAGYHWPGDGAIAHHPQAYAPIPVPSAASTSFVAHTYLPTHPSQPSSAYAPSPSPSLSYSSSPSPGPPMKFSVNEMDKDGRSGRNALACLFCRERRIRCVPAQPPASGEGPQMCQSCTTRKRSACVYPTESRRGHSARHRSKLKRETAAAAAATPATVSPASPESEPTS